jgi:DUF2946 family protein
MPPAARPASHDRRALCALLAVFALMVQMLVPAAAMAAQPAPAGALVICTASGTQTIAPDGKPAAPAQHKGFGGMPCQDCLAAALAVVAAAPITVQRVAYEAARVDHAPIARPIAPRARAPPRPPGQGPPTSLPTA